MVAFQSEFRRIFILKLMCRLYRHVSSFRNCANWITLMCDSRIEIGKSARAPSFNVFLREINFTKYFVKFISRKKLIFTIFPIFSYSINTYCIAGNGYISTDTLKEILKELDSKLTDEDLDNIIEEVDEDGSGTLDFDEFMEMMAG